VTISLARFSTKVTAKLRNNISKMKSDATVAMHIHLFNMKTFSLKQKTKKSIFSNQIWIENFTSNALNKNVTFFVEYEK
jgi:hypothetical protein